MLPFIFQEGQLNIMQFSSPPASHKAWLWGWFFFCLFANVDFLLCIWQLSVVAARHKITNQIARFRDLKVLDNLLIQHRVYRAQGIWPLRRGQMSKWCVTIFQFLSPYSSVSISFPKWAAIGWNINKIEQQSVCCTIKTLQNVNNVSQCVATASYLEEKCLNIFCLALL